MNHTPRESKLPRWTLEFLLVVSIMTTSLIGMNAGTAWLKSREFKSSLAEVVVDSPEYYDLQWRLKRAKKDYRSALIIAVLNLSCAALFARALIRSRRGVRLVIEPRDPHRG